MDAETIRNLIETGLPGARADVQGDDGVHFEATVVCEASSAVRVTSPKAISSSWRCPGRCCREASRSLRVKRMGISLTA